MRFPQRVPDGALTADGLRAALAEWVEFNDQQAMLERGVTPGADLSSPPGPSLGGVSSLRKGLMRGEVEALLGPATRVTPRKEGTLSAESAEYKAGANRVSALFVEGVLVRYSISSD